MNETPWLIRLLLQYGAEIATQDHCKDTPLHHAAAWGHEGVLNILLETNPDISIRINRYDLLNLACNDGQEAVARTSLDYGADITARNRDGDTPVSKQKQVWSHSSAIRRMGRPRRTC
jgi:uncharacterized protein